MAYQSFKELRVWREARDLAVKLYKETADGGFSKDFGLRDQVRRSAVSVASNIAEGYERSTTKDVVRFLFISKGSLSELWSAPLRLDSFPRPIDGGGVGG